ncbi:MAG: copper chaperone PCu(A)C, partial [Anaerolineae bacterium]|nr:copper chaperone PCu(A)C [Anaerolineae bacterium]
HSAMPGSAVYLRIHNRGQSDLTLVSASSSAARTLAFHRTVVEDDIARMEAVDSLLIPAGETVELRPGGMHIMLTGLTDDLLPESALPLQLECDSGEVYALDIPVMKMMMSERDDAVELGDLVFSNRWARPALSGMNVSAMPSG